MTKEETPESKETRLIVQTWEEALQGLEEYKEDQELKDDPTEGWKYLKAALRDEGLSYLERDKPLGKALINLALSLPTGEFR